MLWMAWGRGGKVRGSVEGGVRVRVEGFRSGLLQRGRREGSQGGSGLAPFGHLPSTLQVSAGVGR